MIYQQIIDKYYPQGSRLREVLVSHSRQVADLALDIVRRRQLPLDPAMVEDAAEPMLPALNVVVPNHTYATDY